MQIQMQRGRKKVKYKNEVKETARITQKSPTNFSVTLFLGNQVANTYVSQNPTLHNPHQHHFLQILNYFEKLTLNFHIFVGPYKYYPSAKYGRSDSLQSCCFIPKMPWKMAIYHETGSKYFPYYSIRIMKITFNYYHLINLHLSITFHLFYFIFSLRQLSLSMQIIIFGERHFTMSCQKILFFS